MFDLQVKMGVDGIHQHLDALFSVDAVFDFGAHQVHDVVDAAEFAVGPLDQHIPDKAGEHHPMCVFVHRDQHEAVGVLAGLAQVRRPGIHADQHIVVQS